MPVRRAIDAFRRLSAERRDAVPLLYWLLGNGTQPFKMAKPAAAYVDDARVGRACIPEGEDGDTIRKIPAGQTCGNCRYAYVHLTSQTMICSWVRGSIRRTAWCRFWAPGMVAGKGPDAYDPDRFTQD